MMAYTSGGSFYAETEDINSLWVADRLVWPLNPQTPYLVLNVTEHAS